MTARGRGARGLCRGIGTCLSLSALSLLSPLSAQTVAERAAGMHDGQLRMSFATRPGVCGTGENIMTVRSNDDWEADCEAGPARVALTYRGGTLVDVDTYVGGRWPSPRGAVRDLGLVPAVEAAQYLLTLAETVRTRAGGEAIFPATLAEGARVWPQLIGIAKNSRLPRATRKDAVFWLGQAAGEAALAELAGFVDDQNADLDVRKQAVFALSQLRNDAGVPALIDIARGHADPRVRKHAMFWLGQTGDPRAIALFEEILLGR